MAYLRQLQRGLAPSGLALRLSHPVLSTAAPFPSVRSKEESNLFRDWELSPLGLRTSSPSSLNWLTLGRPSPGAHSSVPATWMRPCPISTNHARFPSAAPTLCRGREERSPDARGQAYHLHTTPNRTPVTGHFPARLINHHLLPSLPPSPSTHKASRERALW